MQVIRYHFNAALRKHAVPSQPSENGAGAGIIVQHLQSRGKLSYLAVPETAFYLVITL